MMNMGLFSNLDLNLDTASNVQPRPGKPRRGVWAPVLVPTTRAKKWGRIWAGLALIAMVAIIFRVGYFFYLTVQMI